MGFFDRADDDDAMHAVMMEAEMMQLVFTKMASSCFEKCANRKHKEPDISLGEMSCADRCVGKYLDASQTIGLVINSFNEEQAKLMQSQQEMQQAYASMGRK